MLNNSAVKESYSKARVERKNLLFSPPGMSIQIRQISYAQRNRAKYCWQGQCSIAKLDAEMNQWCVSRMLQAQSSERDWRIDAKFLQVSRFTG